MAHPEHSPAVVADVPPGAHAAVAWGEGGDWPQDALQAFVLRMAGHGHCVSRTFMNFDRRYALEQLSHAHTMADAPLQELAMALFRHFERPRSGLRAQA